jgi:hypothetical protein
MVDFREVFVSLNPVISFIGKAVERLDLFTKGNFHLLFEDFPIRQINQFAGGGLTLSGIEVDKLSRQ